MEGLGFRVPRLEHGVPRAVRAAPQRERRAVVVQVEFESNF